MSGRHKVPMVGFRPSKLSDYEWLVQEAKDNDMAINAFVKYVLDQYRYGYSQSKSRTKGK